jgi:hypothetical protein
MKIAIKDIVNALNTTPDAHTNYLDRQTGIVEFVSCQAFELAEEGGTADALPQWLRDEFELAEALCAHPDRFEKLPAKQDLNELDILNKFAWSLSPQRFGVDLLQALGGARPFQSCKDILRRSRREKDWYAYRAKAFRQIAIEWCKENGVEYAES